MREKLIRLRMERGITQEQVAEYLGISRPTYTQYESGRRQPGKKNLLKLCELYQVSTDYLLSSDVAEKNTSVSKGYFRIPVLGNVPAGLPIEAVTDIIDWEELPNEMGKPEDFFALRINGNSMEPKFSKGDVVIVRKQDDADSGDIVIAMINGCDAACKKLKKYGKDGIALVSSNTAYPPMFFSNEEIASKSVRILGKVVELRAKF